METRISSATKEVVIGGGRPTVLIGDRINPSGKREMSQALKADNLDTVRREALAQVQAGADVIDVNVSAFGVDEAALLPTAVEAVMDTVDVPLCLDSAHPEALEAALKFYKGKPLINSVTGEEPSLSSILPLAREYGAAVIGLTQDENGVPDTSDDRVAIARNIAERALALGIPREDIIIDCLALALGADTGSGLVTIETIGKVRAELGVNITIGASNVSFGLPDRALLNGAFLAIAIAAGVTCPITDAAQSRQIVLATDLVLGRDRRARAYTAAYRLRRESS
jgi:5-methyltetrahydrofolate--homocysteine methyltransferase